MLFDVSDQFIVDFRMSRNRLLSPVDGIQIHIMTGTVSVQDTSRLDKLLDEFLALHATISFIW